LQIWQVVCIGLKHWELENRLKSWYMWGFQVYLTPKISDQGRGAKAVPCQCKVVVLRILLLQSGLGIAPFSYLTRVLGRTPKMALIHLVVRRQI